VQLQGERQQRKGSGGGYRAALFAAVAGLLLSGVAARLAYLQVVRGEYHREMADHNRIRLIPRRPPRGRILDRVGRVIADNRLSYSVFLEPMQLRPRQWPDALARLSPYIGVPLDKLLSKLRSAGYNSPYPVRVLQGADARTVTLLREHIQQLPGVRVDVELLRHYPNSSVASHLLGYTGEISEKQLAEHKDEGYRLGDIVGKSGVERLLESKLHGSWGGEQVEVDSAGQVVRVLGEVPTRAGKDVRLTIDLGLQKAAEAALGSKRRGAVIAMDPNTGAVLAMASSPTYDANVLSGRIATADWKRLQTPERPLLNRAVRPYPTASTFKIVMTAAGLESGKFRPKTILRTAGGLRIGGRYFRDHNGRGFGSIGFVQALAQSSDTFFYQVGLRIGPEKIAEWSRNFGFGRRTRIGLQSESNGLVPTPKLKLERFGQKWYPGDTANTSIGQGLVLSTPLQNAIMVSAIANGGWKVTPHLVLGTPTVREPVGLSPGTLAVIRSGLRAVVTGGTARRALNWPGLPPNAGKTGSAEHGLRKARQTHAVFVGYAPLSRPRLAVSVFLENGGHGGSDAAPIARQVYRAYFTTGAKKSAVRSTKPVR
jgi:penicillin-binding protein 2